MFRTGMLGLMVCGLLVATPAAGADNAAAGTLVASKAARPGEDVAVVQARLDDFVIAFLDNCNANTSACRTSPRVTNRDGKVVASFVEVDPRSVQTELIPSDDRYFSYLARLTYVEHFYESVGNTPEEALHGSFQRVKSRRLTSLPRYAKGKWSN